MKLVNEFRVGVPIDRAWAVLTDLEQIAPCMPGAQLTGVEGDVYHGTVKVKVGPVSAQYSGTANFEEKVESGYKAVIKAVGKDTRGQGNATAFITAQLTEDGDGTKVVVDTDLSITGKVAQFGRGVLADVSSKLMGQFVSCLESSVLAPGAEAPAPADPVEVAVEPGSEHEVPEAAEPVAPTTATFRPIESKPGIEAPQLDGLGLIVGPLAKRLAPVAAGLGVLLALVLLVRRLRGGHQPPQNWPAPPNYWGPPPNYWGPPPNWAPPQE